MKQATAAEAVNSLAVNRPRSKGRSIPPLPPQISEVVLAELPGGPVQHAANIRLLLGCVAPEAKLTVLPLAVTS
jgi:hypothetical protein